MQLEAKKLFKAPQSKNSVMDDLQMTRFLRWSAWSKACSKPKTTM